nr:hypothetical protein [uncultured Porphyromonas sp.]
MRRPSLTRLRRRLPRLGAKLQLGQGLKRAKRLLLNQRGDGVHSPFAFGLIHRVIRNRRPYYCFAPLREELRDLARDLSREALRRPSALELIYRLLQELRPSEVAYRAAAVSMLPRYLEHAGLPCLKLEPRTEQLAARSCLILESWPSEGEELVQLTRHLQELCRRSPELMLFVHLPRPRLVPQLERLRAELEPQLVLDLLDLQLWFFDPSLTPSRYKSVY